MKSIKKIVLSSGIIIALSSFSVAGGDMVTVEPVEPAIEIVYETEDESSFYVGGSVSVHSAHFSDVSRNFFDILTYEQDRVIQFALYGGYWITKYLAVEGRYSFGSLEEDSMVMNNGWSVFLKPTYRFDDENKVTGENYFSVYGLLGYGSVSSSAVNLWEGKIDNTDFQWGLGLSYTFSVLENVSDYTYRDKWAVFIDYTSLGNDMEGVTFNNEDRTMDLDSVNVGILYYF